MNKIKLNILIITILTISIFTTESYANLDIQTKGKISTIMVNPEVTKGDVFIFLANYYKKNIPESYKYINLNFKDIKKGTHISDSLKKLVYLNLIENLDINIKQNSNISAWLFFRLSEKVLGIKIIDKETKGQLISRNANITDLITIKNFINNDTIEIDTPYSDKILKQKKAILNDVYKTIINGHYDKDKIKNLDLLNNAIEGLVKGTKDKHTVYFPPIKNEAFHDSLASEYEGIGSYVEMEKPGILKITSPIPGSPSEKAGLKGGDIVIKVDDKKIETSNSLNEIVSWIKGPAGTKVKLTINRKGKIININVTREKITINNIDSKKINTNTYYIKIKSFGENVSKDFKKGIQTLHDNNNINKIIIDLRNDGGGYLSEVTEILSYFVPKGENTAVVKYHNGNKYYISKGYDYVDFSKYKIVILQNSGTASASEILIGTLKDYYKNIEIIGEQSYGKGSVQVMKNYSDGSMLKYTIAKWFTGGTETGIDGIGITPNIKLELDYDQLKKYKIDNQLEKAKFIR